MSNTTIHPEPLQQQKNSDDDNEEIMELIRQRLELGRERYSHGVRVDDDTREWGTKDNDWELMAIEEVMDGLVYAAAAIIRLRRRKESVYHQNIR
jgi:hypothetical protein